MHVAGQVGDPRPPRAVSREAFPRRTARTSVKQDPEAEADLLAASAGSAERGVGRAGRGTAPLRRRGPRPPSQSPVHFLGLQPVAYTRCLKYVLFDRQLSQQPSYSPATVGWVARGRARVWGRSVRRRGGGRDGPRSAAGGSPTRAPEGAHSVPAGCPRRACCRPRC